LTDTDKQNSTGKITQTKHNPQKANNAKYSKTKLSWFSRLLRHSARKQDGLIPQRSRAHTRQWHWWIQLSKTNSSVRQNRRLTADYVTCHKRKSLSRTSPDVRMSRSGGSGWSE